MQFVFFDKKRICSIFLAAATTTIKKKKSTAHGLEETRYRYYEVRYLLLDGRYINNRWVNKIVSITIRDWQLKQWTNECLDSQNRNVLFIRITGACVTYYGIQRVDSTRYSTNTRRRRRLDRMEPEQMLWL